MEGEEGVGHGRTRGVARLRAATGGWQRQKARCQTKKVWENRKKSSELSHDKELKNLEEKAAEFKVENDGVINKKSFLSKIFGSKNPANEKKIEQVPAEKKESEIQLKNTSAENREETLIQDGHELTNDLQEKDFFENNKNTENELKNPSYEDDLLQIPAFLRRQAN